LARGPAGCVLALAHFRRTARARSDGKDNPTKRVEWRERVNAARQRRAAWLVRAKAKGPNWALTHMWNGAMGN
jgi:hypothetical protein